jgi:hypothetical protein
MANRADWELKGQSQLTGRGGVALVCYHLARLGIEYAETDRSSPFGDIWAQLPGGKVGIEVKTTYRESHWRVRRSQDGSVDFYCLVRLGSADCHALTAAEMRSIISSCRDMHDGMALVPESTLPANARQGWTRVGITRPTPSVLDRMSREGTGRKSRQIKKLMANGEIKIYTYPR